MQLSRHGIYAYLLLFVRYNDFLVENLHFHCFTHPSLVRSPCKDGSPGAKVGVKDESTVKTA